MELVLPVQSTTPKNHWFLKVAGIRLTVIRKAKKRCLGIGQQGRILSEATVVALGVRSAIHCSLIYVCPSVSFYSFCFLRGARILSLRTYLHSTHVSPWCWLCTGRQTAMALWATSGVFNDLCFVHTGGFTFPKPRWTASTATITWKRVMVKRETNSWGSIILRPTWLSSLRKVCCRCPKTSSRSRWAPQTGETVGRHSQKDPGAPNCPLIT